MKLNLVGVGGSETALMATDNIPSYKSAWFITDLHLSGPTPYPSAFLDDIKYLNVLEFIMHE